MIVMAQYGLQSFSTAFIALLFISVGYSQPTTPATTLQGTVRDPFGAVVPKAIVTIENVTTTRKATTSEYGEYSLSAPPGIYKVAVDASTLGFDVTYRSAIKLDTDSARLDLTVFPKYTVLLPLDGGPHKVLDHPASQSVSFSFEEVPDLSQTGIRNGMIRFATKCLSPFLTTYKGSPSAPYPITFTYDLYTVTAEELRIYPRSKEIWAVGEVTIENSQEKTTHKGILIIRIKDGKLSYNKSE